MLGEKLVFISQPMNGKSNDEIRTERNGFITNPEVAQKICAELDSSNFKVIDTILDLKGAPDINNMGVFYLGESFKLLAKADIAVFMPGWERARGCVMEHHAAVLYGIPHLDF